jgi:hypothetical protein
VTAALLLAVAVGAVALSDVAAPTASRRPLVTSLPNVLRPTPKPSETATEAPRGTATTRVGLPAAVQLPVTPDGAPAVTADDAAAAYVTRAADGAVTLNVTDLRTGQRRFVATTPGRTIWFVPGALRRDLITYVEVEQRGDRPGGGLLVAWHVMVANWRSGAAATELDVIPSEIEPDPHIDPHAPAPRTNGNEVVWLHAPKFSGRVSEILGDVRIQVTDTRAGRSLLLGEASYAIDDRGRIAVVRSTDVASTLWDLLLYEADGSARRLVVGRVQGGTPYLAGAKIVWARTPPGPRNVTSVDIVDIATGGLRTVTKADCAFIGATIHQAVFSCQGHSEYVDVEDGAESTTPAFFTSAEPHAIVGRETSGLNPTWSVTPIP